MKRKWEIEDALEDSKDAVKEHGSDDDALIYQGWVEALEWVLSDVINVKKGETNVSKN